MRMCVLIVSYVLLVPPPLPVGSRRLRMRVVITQLPLGTVELTQKAAGQSLSNIMHSIANTQDVVGIAARYGTRFEHTTSKFISANSEEFRY